VQPLDAGDRSAPEAADGGHEGSRGRPVADVYAGYADSRAAARRWDAANPGNAAIRRELVQAVWSLAGPELAAARDVLDVGCGSGWWLAELAGDGRVSASLHGLDLLDRRVQAARERLGQRAHIASGDARGLPYDDASFDVVSLFTVLSSLAGPAEVKRVLGQAARVVRPGGVLLVWEPRVPNPLNRHTRLVSQALIRSELGAASYQVRTTTVVPALARRLGSRTPSVYRRLSRVRALRTHRLTAVRATPRPS
jgi:ubiquinone/menaquinone biosynthesis C-methylase UbiE